jgi:hypothetical protein
MGRGRPTGRPKNNAIEVEGQAHFKTGHQSLNFTRKNAEAQIPIRNLFPKRNAGVCSGENSAKKPAPTGSEKLPARRKKNAASPWQTLLALY